jgi:NAD+ kinase
VKIAIFGKKVNESFKNVIIDLFKKLTSEKVEIYIYKPFDEFLRNEIYIASPADGYFDSTDNLPIDTKIMMSIGGDGTMLEAISIIRNKAIPVIGINSGRLGFLANVASTDVIEATEQLLQGDFQIEYRSGLMIKSHQHYFYEFPYAFNECTIQKTGSSLITIHVSVDGEYLTSYWADGLIIATPTGSTAYNLSVGGPIVTPNSQVFIISPIAAHNLNFRPLIIPDSSTLKLTIEGRANKFLLTLDSRTIECDIDNEILISKADFSIGMIKLLNISFFSTLRNKLMWGEDRRN